MKYFGTIFLFAFIFTITTYSQTYLTRDIKSFGALGDGKTNDQDAFEKAAVFFNQRHGNGTLVISKGTYLVGKQKFSNGKAGAVSYQGVDVLSFENVNNLVISGSGNPVIRFINNLNFGSFDPVSGKKFDHGSTPLYDKKYAGSIGNCIKIENSLNVQVRGIRIQGNSNHIILGGNFGDVGRQVQHSGIFILNSNDLIISNMQADHFGLDGICISNNSSTLKGTIKLTDDEFEYNSRQGFSLVGGENITISKCKFNHTGRGVFTSSPGAGVDLEPEVAEVKNIRFSDCEFIDNAGCGLAADNQRTSECHFENCIFCGTTMWSIWVNAPSFTFNNCEIYGSFVHGYNSADDQNATRFVDCRFEDKKYNNKDVYGNYLIESNDRRRTLFSHCTFVVTYKKLCWVSSSTPLKDSEKYHFLNCTFLVENSNYTPGDFVGIIRSSVITNCSFEFKDPASLTKKLYIGGVTDNTVTKVGTNKIIYNGKITIL